MECSMMQVPVRAEAEGAEAAALSCVVAVPLLALSCEVAAAPTPAAAAAPRAARVAAAAKEARSSRCRRGAKAVVLQVAAETRQPPQAQVLLGSSSRSAPQPKPDEAAGVQLHQATALQLCRCGAATKHSTVWLSLAPWAGALPTST